MQSKPILTWAAAGVVGLLLLAPAHAATVTDLQGEVLVNTGVGFKKIEGPLELVPGDQIMVGALGSAQVKFADGCSVPVQPGQIVQVGPESPCIAQKEPAAETGGVGANTMIIGGVVVAAGAGLAIGLSGGGSDKKDRPASP